MDEKLQKLQQWIDESEYIVFFGGAGVSTESGIPDFRSVDGLYHQKYKYPPETMLSHTFFEKRPREFYRFYREKLICKGVQPNAAHRKLAELERAGKLKAVVTQNIDGLHQAAGSKNVLELHGSTHRCYCARCGKTYPEEAINDSTDVPMCSCGGIIRPDVVLYEEGLDQEVMGAALRAISRADTLIIGGAAGWYSSTGTPRPTMGMPTWSSTTPSGKCWAASGYRKITQNQKQMYGIFRTSAFSVA